MIKNPYFEIEKTLNELENILYMLHLYGEDNSEVYIKINDYSRKLFLKYYLHKIYEEIYMKQVITGEITIKELDEIVYDAKKGVYEKIK